jgi:hypothetical protein
MVVVVVGIFVDAFFLVSIFFLFFQQNWEPPEGTEL